MARIERTQHGLDVLGGSTHPSHHLPNGAQAQSSLPVRHVCQTLGRRPWDRVVLTSHRCDAETRQRTSMTLTTSHSGGGSSQLRITRVWFWSHVILDCFLYCLMIVLLSTFHSPAGVLFSRRYCDWAS